MRNFGYGARRPKRSKMLGAGEALYAAPIVTDKTRTKGILRPVPGSTNTQICRDKESVDTQ